MSQERWCTLLPRSTKSLTLWSIIFRTEMNEDVAMNKLDVLSAFPCSRQCQVAIALLSLLHRREVSILRFDDVFAKVGSKFRFRSNRFHTQTAGVTIHRPVGPSILDSVRKIRQKRCNNSSRFAFCSSLSLSPRLPPLASSQSVKSTLKNLYSSRLNVQDYASSNERGVRTGCQHRVQSSTATARFK